MENIFFLEIRSSELSVLFYIAVIIIGTVFTTLLFVFAAKKKDDMRVSVRNFNLSLLLCTVADFIFTYFSSIPEGGLAGNAVTASMFISDAIYFFMIICWVLAAENLMGGYSVVNRNLLIFGTIAYGVCAEIIVAATMTASGDEIRLSGGTYQDILLVMNLAFGCFILYCGIRLTAHGLISLFREKARWRIFIAPVLFSFCLAYYMGGTAIWDYRIVSSGIVSKDDIAMIDPAVLIYMILCMLLVIFMHTRGYYIMGEQDPSRMNEDDIEHRRETLTEKFGLSARESEVLLLVLNGKSNMMIAKELFISEYTVKRHLNTVFKKTGFSGRYELISGRVQRPVGRG